MTEFDFFDLYIFLFCFFIAICFIIERIVEMNFAKKCAARKYGLVWLPIGREYVLGQIADMYENKSARRIYTFLSGISCLFAFLSILVPITMIIGFSLNYELMDLFGIKDDDYFLIAILVIFFLLFVMSTVKMIYKYFVFYRIFNLKDRAHSTMWIVLFIFFGLFLRIEDISLIIFMLKNMNKPSIPKIYEAENMVAEIAE